MKQILGCMALGLVTMAAAAQWSNPSDDVPAYNVSAPVKPLPAVLSGDQLTGIYFTRPYQVTAYKMAAAIPAVALLLVFNALILWTLVIGAVAPQFYYLVLEVRAERGG